MTFINRFRTYAGIEIHSLKQYLANPTRTYISQSNWQDKLKRVFMLYGFYFFSLLIISPLLLVLQSTSSDLERSSSFGEGVFAFLLIGILMPIFEELIFRWGLRSLFYTLFLGPFFIAACFVSVNRLDLVWFALALSCAWGFLHLFKLRKFGKEKKGAKFSFGRQFISEYKKIFFTYAILFGIVHIGKWGLNDWSNWIVIFLVIPQIIMGFLLGYIRIRDGLMSSIYLHALNNSMVCLFAIASV